MPDQAQLVLDKPACGRGTAVPRLPLFLGLAVVALAAVGLVLLGLNWNTAVPPRWGFRGFQSLTAVPTAIVGAIIARRQPRNPIGWLFLVSSLFAGLTGLGEEVAAYALLTRPNAWPGGELAAAVSNVAWIPSMGLLGIHVVLLFPDGRFLSPRWRIIAWLGAAWILIGSFRLIIEPGPLFNMSTVANPFGIENLQTPFPWPAAIPVFPAISAGFLLMFISALFLVLRFRQANGMVRQQIKWVAYVAALVPMAGVVGYSQGVLANLLVAGFAISLPVAMGIAILRYQLYDIDFLINRTLVYGALMACVVGIYALVVGAAGALAQAQSNWLVALLATGLVAVLFQPLRERLQRSVNRLVYGERDDPVAVFSKLGERMETAVAPNELLPILAETIARTLKLSYVAVGLQTNGSLEIAAAYGKPTHNPVTFPLAYQGKTIGELLVAPRQTGESFSPAEMALLQNIAWQAGTAVHAAQLSADLRRSRQRLVTAREEERRRLRRDLHDDLGPKLASLTLSLDAIGKLMDRDPAAAAELLRELKEQSQTAVQDIRRLVYDLRPPALDDLGLAAALRESATRYRSGGIRITIKTPEPLSPLPAAVEVAAFRIAQEAMTNAVRHAQAQVCRVTLTLEPGVLCVTVQDDGRGLPADLQLGIGLRSMQERVAELDGRLLIESRPGGGTTVKAILPLKE